VAKLLVQKESTSRREYLFIQNNSVGTGAGLTGLAFNSAGLGAWYVRTGAAAVAISLVSQTPTGAYSSGGFAEVDAANMPGVYRFDVPNTTFATGSDKAIVMLKGATNMAPVVLEYQLTDFDPENDISSIRLQTDRLIFNSANEVTVAITNAAAFAQSAADKMWNTTSRSLTSLGGSAADVWNVVCESAGSYTAKQIMSVLLSLAAGRTANSRRQLKTPDGTATRVDVTMAGAERSSVTVTPSG
jgi:hypothetical protein